MFEDDIRKLLTSKKLLIGKDEVLKNIRRSLVQKVYTASNCPPELKKELEKYSAISGFELMDTKVPNDELGTVCKKPFSIAVLGVLR